MSKPLKAHILLIVVTAVWGATFVQIKDALRDATPLALNAVRMIFAASVLLVVYFREVKTITRKALVAGVVTGVWLWAGYELQTSGLVYTTPSKSAFLTGISVVLVPVFLAVFWRRAVTRWTALGVTAAFVGLFLLTVPPSRGSLLGDFASVNRGDLLTIAAAVSFGFQIIFLGRATREHPFKQIALLQVTTAALLMGLVTPLAENIHMALSWRVISALLVTGLIGTAAAFTIQAWAQQYLTATSTALIFALEPVFAMMVSWVYLGEHLSWRGGLGAALILGGILVSELLSGSEPKADLSPIPH
jgi:drug/metabolite transporter (DMT)-like permease